MNLDNERKAFEDWAKKETCWDLYWSENIKQYLDHQTNGAWFAWQASIQREGYKLVPVEINDEIESAMFSSVARGEMPCDIYKAMIEAQESTND